ncbi:ABC transporter G family member [Trichinella spiralis]|uniref:ABC transporter G family member n=1 Tax=Trichinella spiralis TaxID=6334 RepID=A0ABR3KTP0_TRISP
MRHSTYLFYYLLVTGINFSDVYQQHSCHRRSSVAEVNNSSIIISHLDIQHGNTCAELEFPSPISSVIKRCHICKSASTTVSKREAFSFLVIRQMSKIL